MGKLDENGVSYQDVAEKLEVSEATTYFWKVGKRGPYHYNLGKLRNLYNEVCVNKAVEEVTGEKKEESVRISAAGREPVAQAPVQTQDAILLDELLHAPEEDLPVIRRLARRLRKAAN
jgi:hypothetical protein